MQQMINTCPVCGYVMRHLPIDFHICPCCGTEFGYDDAGRTHADLRASWLRSGAQWWSPNQAPPPNWDPYTQIDNLTFPLQAVLFGTLPAKSGLEDFGFAIQSTQQSQRPGPDQIDVLRKPAAQGFAPWHVLPVTCGLSR